MNVHAVKTGDDETVISVTFTELLESIIIDSTASTSLSDEYLLNSEGLLEVVKKYKNGGKASVYIRAIHPTNKKCYDLLLKKNSELKKIIAEHDISCENPTVNPTMRKAIWDKFKDDLDLKEIDIDASKEDAKRIWDRLAFYMPIYSLFQSDRKNSDGDNEVQYPLKEVVKQIINDSKIQNTLTGVAKIVESKLKEVADRTLDKFREMDPAVANSLNPVIPSADKLKWPDVFKTVSITEDENILINKRGSGVKRLILLNFFRAEAERRAENGNNTGVVYGIEEPETSQHPDSQRILINALKELAQKPNVQVLLTTHSPVIVKKLNFSDICLIYE